MTSEMGPNPAKSSKRLAQLLPSSVLAAELVERADPDLLYPQEQALLGRSVPKRVDEFTAGRLCARRVLAQLGVHRFPLLIGEKREPLWPENIVGSITHCSGFRAAVAGYKSELLGVGIDCEAVERLDSKLWKRIMTPEESHWINSLPSQQQLKYATLIFSAKESFYKCQYAITKQWVGFEDAALISDLLDIKRGRFTLSLLKPIEGFPMDRAIRGRFLFEQGRVLTAVVISIA